MTHVISFRRPELAHSLARMTVPSQEDPLIHIHRLENLGYKIVDISPPLAPCGPPQRPAL